MVTNEGTVDEKENLVVSTEIYSTFIGFKNAIFISIDNANFILQKEHYQCVKNIFTALEKQNSSLLN